MKKPDFEKWPRAAKLTVTSALLVVIYTIGVAIFKYVFKFSVFIWELIP
jgi:hypothetical protein